MKKSLFMLGAALVALSSCTQNEVLNVNESRTIGFDGFIGKPTRAETTNENITTFQVFGGFDSQYTNVFNDVAVNRTGDSGSYTWASETIQYWQADKAYTFNAYAPEGNGTVSVGAGGISINGFKATDGGTDLIIAETVSKTADATFMASPDKVKFSFKHVLSMIKFTFSTDLAGVNIKISELKVNGVLCQGDYNSNGWQNITGSAAYSLNVDGTITNASAKASTEAIVIPQTTTDGGITVSFKLKAEGALDIEDTDARTVNIPATTWAQGNRYNYTAKITAQNIDPDNILQPIEFDAPTVEQWADADSGSYTDDLPGYVTQP